MLNCKNVYVLYGYKISQNESFLKEKTKLKTLKKLIYKVVVYYDSQHFWVKYSTGLMLKIQSKIANMQTIITVWYSRLSDTLFWDTDRILGYMNIKWPKNWPFFYLELVCLIWKNLNEYQMTKGLTSILSTPKKYRDSTAWQFPWRNF